MFDHADIMDARGREKGGHFHAVRFYDDALDRLRRTRSRITVRAYGEMVDVLWKEGRDLAAIQLEVLWNRLARATEFSLMCGYATESFVENVGVKEVCRQHTHLVDADGMARVSNVDTLLVD